MLINCNVIYQESHRFLDDDGVNVEENKTGEEEEEEDDNDEVDGGTAKKEEEQMVRFNKLLVTS
jgi:hypothetical protein